LADRLRGLPLPHTVGGWITPSVVLATVAATVAIGLLLGTVPLVRGLRRAEGRLRDEGLRTTDGRPARRLRHAIVITQVALAVSPSRAARTRPGGGLPRGHARLFRRHRPPARPRPRLRRSRSRGRRGSGDRQRGGGAPAVAGWRCRRPAHPGPGRGHARGEDD